MRLNGIRKMLGRYLRGQANPEENARIDKWYDSVDDNREVFDDDSHRAAIKDRLYGHIVAEISAEPKVIPLYRRPSFRVAAAAVILILIGAGAFLVSKEEQPVSSVIAQARQPLGDVEAPGINKATLTLGNGQMILLDSFANGKLAIEANNTIEKTADGHISYSSALSLPSAQILFNTLANPRGSKMISVTLSDGTQVWLNSYSSITFPVNFAATERRVQITGEAYFEVKRDPSRPFVVGKVNDKTEITVLGTHFNVNSYDDEAGMKVTLLEGSVWVYNDVRSRLLKPGQQAETNRHGEISLHNDVDTDEVVAWKNGVFNFNSITLEGVMRQVSRWYDVDVVYAGPVTDKHFSGIVNRGNNVSEVLKIIEAAGVKFRIEGKRITIY